MRSATSSLMTTCPKAEINITIWEMAEFRHRVATAHHRRGFKSPVTWITFQGGPLTDLRIPVETWETSNQSIGWCTPRPDGPALAMYRRSDMPATFVFEGWSSLAR